MQSHIPDKGSALVVYGPHIGIDAGGIIGKINRRGQGEETTCCGSALAAMDFARQQSIASNRNPATASAFTLLDLEQSQVNSLVLAQKDRIFGAQDPTLELPYALFDMQELMLRQIILEAAPNSPITLLGGIQINTPEGQSDYFCPLRFHTTDIAPTGLLIKQNLLDELV